MVPHDHEEQRELRVADQELLQPSRHRALPDRGAGSRRHNRPQRIMIRLVFMGHQGLTPMHMGFSPRTWQPAATLSIGTEYRAFGSVIADERTKSPLAASYFLLHLPGSTI